MMARNISMLMVAACALVLGGCLGSDGGSDGATAPTVPPAVTTADFFHLAIVPNQTVTTATFEVQVIAENIDPSSPPSAPVVIDTNGNSYTMVLKTLKWPGTAVDSVQVYAYDVPLILGDNGIKVVSGTKYIPGPLSSDTFLIRRVASLKVYNIAVGPIANMADLRAAIQAAITDKTIDEIRVDYAEADIGLALHNVGNGFANARDTWLTIKPGTGSMTWLRDYAGVRNTLRTPKVDFLNLSGVIWGAHTSDGGANQFEISNNHRIWISNSEFRAKYKGYGGGYWAVNKMVSAPYMAEFNIPAGHKLYITDSLWDGTAANSATQFVELARDLRFNSHRGDYNQFGRAVLNVSADNAFAVQTQDTNSQLTLALCPPPDPALAVGSNFPPGHPLDGTDPTGLPGSPYLDKNVNSCAVVCPAIDPTLPAGLGNNNSCFAWAQSTITSIQAQDLCPPPNTALAVGPANSNNCTDRTHNDGFQVWGAVSNVVFKGFKVASTNEPAYLQPFLFDRTYTPNYSNVLVDSIIIVGATPALPAAPVTADRAQLAGVISNSRISNISFPEQGLEIRDDFTEPSGAFTPTNVRIHNADLWGVTYSSPAPVVATAYSSNYGNVGGNPADISGILNAIPGVSGATFSSIKVK